MKQYALIIDGVVKKVSRTKMHESALPVEHLVPSTDPATQMVEIDPVHHWAVHPDKVVATYTITERDLEAEAAALRAKRDAMEVSRFQARAALRQAGLRDQVDAIMANPDTDPLTVDAWNDAQSFRRLSPTILNLAAALELSDEYVDQLFEQAAQIDA